MLTGDPQGQVVQAAERGQIRSGEGSVVHVEVFWMDSVGTSIISGPRSLSPPGPGYRPTPSSVKSHYGAKKVGVRGGRPTWQDKKKIYQWDRPHEKLEVYRKSDKEHLGKFDLEGNQTKPPVPGRRPSGY